MAENSVRADRGVDKYFDFYRFENYLTCICLMFYAPIGLALLVIRLAILINVWLITTLILPQSSPTRSFIHRAVFCILGVVIQDDDIEQKTAKGCLLISNRISDFDPLLYSFLFPCSVVSSGTYSYLVKSLMGDQALPNKRNIQDITTSTRRIVCFPESSRTNGRVGLFKFQSWPFETDLNVHLIQIAAQSPLFQICLSPIGSSPTANFLWLLFVPVTVFSFKYHGSMTKKDENATDFSKSVQTQMAEKCRLDASNFDLSDKKEMMKRHFLEQIQPTRPARMSTSANNRIQQMALRVKEVLPQVPIDVIKRDLVETRNVDQTIERFISGVIEYVPEENETPASGTSVSDAASSSSPLAATNVDMAEFASLEGSDTTQPINTAATSYAKTTDERMLSFQERKERLFRVARYRFMKKHGLLTPSSPAPTQE